MITEKTYTSQPHKSTRSPWLRAAVLGANDGIVSTASLMLGVAAANASRTTIMTAGFAGLIAGALSMAIGEYVSVSSQKDAEKADLVLEASELKANEKEELQELADIYVGRGLTPTLANEVAQQLHDHDALGAHARDELGINQDELSRPVQAAIVSAASFAFGAAIPLLAAYVFIGPQSIMAIITASLIGLGIMGSIGAVIGGGHKLRAALRVFIGGGLAMLITAILGKLIGGVGF